MRAIRRGLARENRTGMAEAAAADPERTITLRSVIEARYQQGYKDGLLAGLRWAWNYLPSWNEDVVNDAIVHAERTGRLPEEK